MAYIDLGILDDVVSVYDQTKTTINGRVSIKNIDGVDALGPSVPNWADVTTDAGFAPGLITMSRNIVGDIARVFVTSIPAVGTAVSIALYNYTVKTGVSSYVGKIVTPVLPNAASSTHTLRGLDIIDTGTTGWKIYLATTATVAINGGVFLLNNISLSDFTPLGTTILLPTGNDQKAMYMLQDNINIGVNQLNIASVGLIVDAAINKVYVHDGVVASHRYFVYNTNVAPTYLESVITGTNANPGVLTLASHGFLNNDPVFFKTTGSFSGLTNNTVYFARNVTDDTFQLSLTSGGASISTVGTQAGTHTIGRAYGTTGACFSHKTANLPTLLGVLLASNYENPATPTDPSYGALVGQDCVGFGTTTNLYMGKLSDLDFISKTGTTVTSGSAVITTIDTSGLAVGMPVYGAGIPPLATILSIGINAITLSLNATASSTATLSIGQNLWPSLTTANVLGSVNEVVVPVLTAVQYSSILDCFVFVSNTSFYYGKRLVNNSYLFKGGRLNTSYYETTIPQYGSTIFGVSALGAFTLANGIAILGGTGTGQRGYISCDMRSDVIFDEDFFVTKVLNLSDSTLKHFIAVDKLYDFSNVIACSYRTSGFGSISGGWTLLSNSEELSIVLGSSGQIQFKVAFYSVGFLSQTPPQISNFEVVTIANDEISTNWEYSHDDSTSGSPTRASFRLRYAYNTSIPTTLNFRSYDLSGTLLINQTITSNPSNFEYSSDNGSTWLPLGTIPNTVGTLVRYSFTSPPGVDIRVSLKDA